MTKNLTIWQFRIDELIRQLLLDTHSLGRSCFGYIYIKYFCYSRNLMLDDRNKTLISSFVSLKNVLNRVTQIFIIFLRMKSLLSPHWIYRADKPETIANGFSSLDETKQNNGRKFNKLVANRTKESKVVFYRAKLYFTRTEKSVITKLTRARVCVWSWAALNEFYTLGWSRKRTCWLSFLFAMFNETQFTQLLQILPKISIVWKITSKIYNHN